MSNLEIVNYKADAIRGMSIQDLADFSCEGIAR